MKKKKAKRVVILLIMVLVAVVADIFVRLSVPEKPSLQYSKMLIKVGMEGTDCANKLLKAVNLTNIHIVPPETLEARRYNKSKIK